MNFKFRVLSRSGILAIFFILAALFLFACGSSNSPTQSELTPLSMSQFPHGIGAQWIYEVMDSASASIDTMTVTVASDTATPLPGFTSSELWIYSVAGTPIDTVRVVYNDSSMVLQSPVGAVVVVFPVIRPTVAVTVPAGTFKESYKITSGYYLYPNDSYFLVDYWLVKDNGIVKYEFNANVTTPKLHYTAELLQYIPAPSVPMR
ncbi:MAG TPA: hypothetical protein VJ983_06005 [candidate division Zixibacteria bacterium]|nr:hypothetical protein [candidate division Zixibacteria bacterium]